MQSIPITQPDTMQVVPHPDLQTSEWELCSWGVLDDFDMAVVTFRHAFDKDAVAMHAFHVEDPRGTWHANFVDGIATLELQGWAEPPGFWEGLTTH